jgi:hypothetical protein
VSENVVIPCSNTYTVVSERGVTVWYQSKVSTLSLDGPVGWSYEKRPYWPGHSSGEVV